MLNARLSHIKYKTPFLINPTVAEIKERRNLACICGKWFLFQNEPCLHLDVVLMNLLNVCGTNVGYVH